MNTESLLVCRVGRREIAVTPRHGRLLRPASALVRAKGSQLRLVLDRGLVVLAVSTSGCTHAPVAGPNPCHQVEKAVVKAPPEARRYVTTDSPSGPVRLSVAVAAAADGPGSPEKLSLWIAGEGAVLGPLGLAAPPLFASGLVLGGALLFLGGGAIYGVERHRANATAKALQESNFPLALAEALQRRARTTTVARDLVAQGEATLDAWGIIRDTGRSNSRHCFVAQVRLTIATAGTTRLDETLRIGWREPSPDAPVPQCAELAAFLDADARLLRATARDYAETLAIMIIERVGNLK